MRTRSIRLLTFAVGTQNAETGTCLANSDDVPPPRLDVQLFGPVEGGDDGRVDPSSQRASP